MPIKQSIGNTYSYAEYVWLGKNPDIEGMDVRSKTKVLQAREEPPMWNYDGSSTEQAPGGDSEVIIKPVKTYPDPFRNPEKDILVLCDTYKMNPETAELTPLKDNARPACKAIMDAAASETPRFGLEQEFFLIDCETNYPVGFTTKDDPQGNFYCGVLGMYVDAKLRNFVESFLENARVAGLKISGFNLEVAPGQLEYQVDSYGVDCGDDLFMSRYIAQRTAQGMGCFVDLSARVVDGDFNGSGCHTNFSVKSMMQEGGWEFIEKQVLPRLEENAFKHIERYGNGNCARLSGKHETASWKKFSYGIGSRKSSIRIPTLTYVNKRGYLEDRRPSSVMNPYNVTGLIIQTILGVCPEIEFPIDLPLARDQDGKVLDEQPVLKKTPLRPTLGERIVLHTPAMSTGPREGGMKKIAGDPTQVTNMSQNADAFIFFKKQKMTE